MKRDFKGKLTRELQGAAELTYAEAAEIVGAAIGKSDLTYQHAPGEQVRMVLVQTGVSPKMADLILEMAEALNTGHMKMLEPRSPKNATPTRLKTFVEEAFVPAYYGQASSASASS